MRHLELFLRALSPEVKASGPRVFSRSARTPFLWARPKPWDIVVVDSSTRVRKLDWDLPEDSNVEVRISNSDVEITGLFGGISVDCSWLLPYASDSTLCANVNALFSVDLREVYRVVTSGQKDGPPEEWSGLLAALEAGVPQPDFPTIGEPVPLNGQDSTAAAKELNWQWYAVHEGWLFQQDDADRFWVGGGSSANWDATANTNWSATSGGANNASVPIAGDTQTFDANGNSGCTVNVAIPALASTTTTAGYTATINVTIDQSTTDAWGATSIAGGTFNTTIGGSTNAIRCTTFTMSGGTIAITGSRFVTTTGTVNITAGTWTTGYLRMIGTSAADFTASITITQLDIAQNNTTTLLGNITVSTALFVSSSPASGTATLAANSRTITVTGAGTVEIGTAENGTGRNGVVTFTTGTLDTGTGAITIGQASGGTGSLGSNTAWTFTQDGALTNAATGTINAPTGTGWTATANIDISAGTFNADSGTITVGTSLNFTGRSGTASNVPYNITVNLSQTMTVTAASAYTNVLTVNGVLAQGSAGHVEARSGAATPLVMGGSGSITGTTGSFEYLPTVNAVNVAATTYRNLQLISNFAGITTFTPGGNVTAASGFVFGNNNGNFLDVYAGGTTTLAITGSATIGQGASNFKGSLQFSTGTCTVTTTSLIYAGSDITYSGAGTYTQTQEMTLNGSASWNAATVSIGSGRSVAATQLSLGATAVFTGGTGPHTVGSITWTAGASYTATSATTTINGTNTNGSTPLSFQNTTGAGFVHNNGTVSITTSGAYYIGYATVGPTFYNLTLANGTISIYGTGAAVTYTVANNLAINSGSFSTINGANTSQNLTVTNATSIATGATLTCNASTCIFNGTGTASGFSLETAGTGIVNMGSATVTAGSIYYGGTGTNVVTTGTLTINSGTSGNVALQVDSGITLTVTSSTIAFTRAGTQLISSQSNTARTLNNLTANNASLTLQFANGTGCALTVAGNLVLTAGTVTTSDVTGGTRRNLTVTGTSSITGTLNVGGSSGTSTWTFNGDTSVASGGTLGENSAYTLDLNNGLTIVNGGTFNLPNGSGTFTYSGTATQTLTLNSGSTINHDSGTLNVDGTGANSIFWGAQSLYNVTISGSGGLAHTSSPSTGTVANNLTINASTTFNTANITTFTVTAATTCSGTMTNSNNTLSLGSGLTGASYALLVDASATFNGGSGPHTIGNLRIDAGTWTATSNTTTIDGRQSGGNYIWYSSSSAAQVHNSGTVSITNGGATGIIDVSSYSPTFYNLSINQTNGTTLYSSTASKLVTAANNLTVAAGTLNSLFAGQNSVNLTVTATTSITGTLTPNTSTITLNGACTINNLGVFGGNSAYVLDSNAAFTVSAGGTFKTPSGAGTFTMSGTSLSIVGVVAENGVTWTFDGATDTSTTADTSTYATTGLSIGAMTLNKSIGNSSKWNIPLEIRGDLVMSQGTYLADTESSKCRVLGAIRMSSAGVIWGIKGRLLFKNISGGGGQLIVSPQFDFRHVSAPRRTYGAPIAGFPGQCRYA